MGGHHLEFRLQLMLQFVKARGQKKQKTKVFDYKLIIALLND